MKSYFFFFILFLNISFSQGQTEPKKDQYNWPAYEKPPIYKGCETLKTDYALKECMRNKIQKLVSKNFDTLIAKSLGLPNGKIHIKNSFKIDTSGKIVDIKVNAPHPKLAEESKRVIGLIPEMTKPATFKDKSIEIMYRFPILFTLNK